MNESEILISRWEKFFSERVKKRRDLTAGYVQYVEALSSHGLPPIFELRHLSELAGFDLHLLAGYVSNSQAFYRTYRLLKRNGGERAIDVPTPGLLKTQQWILKNILESVPLHLAAHGFVLGRSIRTNAEMHLGKKYLLKCDISSFFPSITLKRGIATFLRMGYAPNVAFYLAALCFKDGRLPQGAATSPAISNIIAKRLDARLTGFSNSHDLTYTRYADDLTFSGDAISASFVHGVRRIIGLESFQVNEGKTILSGPGKKKVVAGVSISSGKMRLPRRSVRAIKQDAHFLLKFGYFSYVEVTGNRDPLLLERLLGRIGFWLLIEPENSTAIRLLADLRRYRSTLDFELASLRVEPDIEFS